MRTDSDQRRQTILEAALECFAADGYDATSIEEICELSGASVGSVYHHYGSKEGVAAALYAEGIAGYQKELLAILASGGSPDTVVPALVRHHVDWVRTNPGWARYLLLMGHAPATVEALTAVRDHNRVLLDQLAGWAEPHIAARRLLNVSPLVLLALILGPAHALSRAWLSGTEELDDTTIASIATAAVRSTQP
ncbi:MAG: TetR/AcrR family transcriptional regulator [Acidimicrobiia bacterium]|nr:TetR/AcrR family transcriptional regulator [Acidimicrobiia bacterium]